VPVTVSLGCLFLVRAAVRATLRIRIRAHLLEAVAASLLSAAGDGTDLRDADGPLFVGLQSAEDLVSQRLPDLWGDVPACIILAGVLVDAEPLDLVLKGALAIAAGAVAVVLARRFTAASTLRVWDAILPAMDDLSTAIHARVELVGNGDDATFLRGLSTKVRAWEAESRGAARISFLAGRAPMVAAVAVVALFLIRHGGWHSGDLAAAAVIASVTPAFAGVARGALDVVRDRVRAQPVVDCFEAADARAAPSGTAKVSLRPEIAWEDVSFAYDHRPTRALDHVSATWKAHELLAVAGPNGSGKSTFVRLLLGLQAPTTGKITLAATPLTEIDGPDLRRRLGFLPQRPFLPDHMTVGRAVALIAPEASPSAVEAALGRVDVWSVLTRRDPTAPLTVKLGALSAGEKQRVAIARVLLRGADVLILDEPDANLDASGIARLGELLREEATQRMVIFTAHDPLLLAQADRVLHFVEGRLRDA